jgi:hypothetical protein
MEYQSVTHKVSLSMKSILENAKQLQHAHFYFVVSGLKIIGPGNPDNHTVEGSDRALLCGTVPAPALT